MIKSDWTVSCGLLGVDDILAKTQEDLDRIKASSFFQRKKPTTPLGDEAKSVVSPGSNAAASASAAAAATGHDDGTGQVKWVGFGEGSKGLQEEEAEQEFQEALKKRQVTSPDPATPVPAEEEQVTFDLPVEDEESDHQEADEDIFDTAYVDVVTSGELKFAYVPDSPTLDSAAGDDPFDTSDVDKIIGPVVVAKAKKQLVSIGAAAHILNTTERPKARSIQPPAQLELFSFGDEDPVAVGSSLPAETGCGNDLFDLPNEETLPAAPVTPDIKDILAEFDVIPEGGEPIDEQLFEKPVEPVQQEQAAAADPPAPVPAPLIDEEDFEFEALALESLSKNNPDDWEEPVEEDDPFDTSCVAKVLQLAPEPVKKPSRAPPARPSAPSRPLLPAKSPIDPALPVSDDPFDTSIVKDQLPVDRPLRPVRPLSPAPPGRPVSPAPPGRPLSPAPPGRPLSPAPPARPVSPALVARSPSPAPPVRPTADPFDTSAVDPFDTSAVDPFDTSAVDPFDTSAVDPFDTSAVDQSLVAASSSFVDADDLVIDEDDPFDTSAVVLN